MTKGGVHLVRTLFDLAKHALQDIGGANGLPMLLGEIIKGQAGGQVTLQAGDSGGISGGIFFTESDHLLFGLLAIILVEDSLEFRFHVRPLGLGNVTEDIVHLVFDAALATTVGELQFNGVEHGPVAIANP